MKLLCLVSVEKCQQTRRQDSPYIYVDEYISKSENATYFHIYNLSSGMMASTNGMEVATFSHSQANTQSNWPDLLHLFRGVPPSLEYAAAQGFSNDTLDEMAGD